MLTRRTAIATGLVSALGAPKVAPADDKPIVVMTGYYG